jgi:hypothetical protein
MKLERQLCPLEHARRLKELGVAQQSLCYYSDKGIEINIHPDFRMQGSEQAGISIKENPDSRSCAAFSVAELGTALPPALEGITLTMEKGEEMDYVSYPGIKTTFGNTEAQARANMLIWLIENKYTTVREVNERLMENG